MAKGAWAWRLKTSQLIVLILLNLMLLPVTLRGEPVAGGEAVVNASVKGFGESNPNLILDQQDNEVEIEDVDVEVGSPDTFEGSSSTGDDEVQGSGIKYTNGSDPTAVAKVYEAPVPNFVSGGTEDAATGGKVSTAPKPNRVKVACWDFRTMPVLVLNDTSSINGTENGTTTSGAGEQSEPLTSEEEILSEFVSEGEENYDDVEGMDYLNRTVEIVNMTYLLHDVLYSNAALKLRSNPANCSVVMFYANWCPFSARAAPHFNALPRAYPPLRAAAIDSSKHKNVNTYFGILSVPTVVLFHNGKIIAKFNDTSFTLTKFAEFIEYFTDLKHEERINVTTKDFDGPLSSMPVKDRDWYLYLAWIFIIFCFFHYVTKTAIWRRAVDFVRTTWREAEAQHEHID